MSETDEPKVAFICPKDGPISREEVAFLCNTCGKGDLIVRDGIFLCPECLKDGENFQCMLCDSKEVKVVIDGQEHHHL